MTDQPAARSGTLDSFGSRTSAGRESGHRDDGPAVGGTGAWRQDTAGRVAGDTAGRVADGTGSMVGGGAGDSAVDAAAPDPRRMGDPPVADPPGGWRQTLTELPTLGDGTGLTRWRTFAGLFLFYLYYAVIDLWSQALWKRPLGLALILAFCVLYLRVPKAVMDPGLRRRGRLLASMIGLTVVYLAVCGLGGLVFMTYLAVTITMLLPLVIAVPTMLAIAALVLLLPAHVASWDTQGLQWSVAIPVLFTGVLVTVMRLNWRTHAELHAAREEVARLATERERLRIARDLHDLLGHSLTTVIVKAELGAKLASRDAERAAAEMVEVAAVARQGLADVRAAVAGYREVSVAHELATAREVLRAAGITADVPGAVDAVPADLRELFGWVVREGVTNAVRYSRATNLRIELTPRSIAVIDDGIGVGPAHGGGNRGAGAAAPRGSGLAGLAERAAVLGGTVHAGAREPVGFCLRVEVPR
ncbi:MAG: sensor histidine kinase [Frankia sp.]